MTVIPDDVTWTDDPEEYGSWRELWEPYVSGPETPSGEIEAHCPEHHDTNPSAQVNFYVGAWKCYSCGSAGWFSSYQGEELHELMAERDEVPEWVTSDGGYSKRKVRPTDHMPSGRQVKKWCDDLFSEEFKDQLQYLRVKRRLDPEILRKRLVGYSDQQRAYTIPLYTREGNGAPELRNVKFRAQHVGNKSMWTVHGATTYLLWPDDALSPEAIARTSQDLYIVEGEMDVFAAETIGLRAITSAGGAHGKWDAAWSRRIADAMARHAPEGHVWVVPDFDDQGEAFAARVVASLRSVGMSPRVLRLPLDPEDEDNHGADLNDVLKELRTPAATRAILARAAEEAVGSGEADHVTETDEPVDDVYEKKVAKEVQRLTVLRDARERELDVLESRSWEPLDGRDLATRLEEGVPPVSFRVEDLMPSGSNTLVVGREKAGKTTLMGNLIRSFVSGEPFLDDHAVDPIQEDETVVMFNYEVGEDQWLNWLDDMGLAPWGENIIPVTLRGRKLEIRSSFVKEHVIRFLSESNAKIWIPDPYARAYGGDENDNTEVGRWLELIDEIKERSGVEEVVLVTHSGRGESGKSRGAQRLEDWPDAIWKLSSTPSGARLFSAYGRDVYVDPPEELAWKAEERRMVKGVNPVEVRMGEIMQVCSSYAPHPLEWEDLVLTVLGPTADLEHESRGHPRKLWKAALDAGERDGHIVTQGTLASAAFRVSMA